MSDEVEYCDSTDKYYSFTDEFSPGDVCLMYDEDGCLQEHENCVCCVDSGWWLRDDCTNAGEGPDGDLWVHGFDYIKDYAELFWKNMETGAILYREDINVQEWMEGADEEGHDPAFFKCMMEVFAEEKAAVEAVQDKVLDTVKKEVEGGLKFPLPISQCPRPLPVGTEVSYRSLKAAVVKDFGWPFVTLQVSMPPSEVFSTWEVKYDGIEVMVEKYPEPVVKQEETVCQ
jgi:hypothetical protein